MTASTQSPQSSPPTSTPLPSRLSDILRRFPALEGETPIDRSRRLAAALHRPPLRLVGSVNHTGESGECAGSTTGKSGVTLTDRRVETIGVDTARAPGRAAPTSDRVFRDDGDATTGTLPHVRLGPGGDFTRDIDLDACPKCGGEMRYEPRQTTEGPNGIGVATLQEPCNACTECDHCEPTEERDTLPGRFGRAWRAIGAIGRGEF